MIRAIDQSSTLQHGSSTNVRMAPGRNPAIPSDRNCGLEAFSGECTMNGGTRLSFMGHFPGAEWFWRRVVLALALGFVNPIALAQEAIVFALRGDGTATVVVDKATHKAWITDGGRSGTQGVREARVGEQDMLNYLQAIGIVDLAIICSHPHSDHMGGLEDTIQDARILGFGSILLVDNGLAHKRSLAGLFEEKWGSSPLKKPEVKYASAERAEVFARSKMAGESVRVTNFAYNPKKVGRGEHDRSVIMQYALPGAENRVMVDFDDASEALVKRWVERKGAKATVVIHPHHGSRYNSIEALIKSKDRIGLKDVVITVNRYNRYLHPAPEIFLNLLERLGPAHVFVTDSDIGDNVTVTGAKTSDGRDLDEHVARLRSFAVAQRDRFEAKLRHKFQTDALLDPIAITASWNLDQQKARSKKAKRDVPTAVRTLLEGVLAYDQAIAILDNKPSAKGQGIPPFKPRRRPPPEDARGGSPNVPPENPSGGTGAFFDLEQEAAADLGASGRKSTNTSARFQAELERNSPRYGGIIIGNKVGIQANQDVTPKSLDFIDVESAQNDEQRQVAVRVTFTGGSTVDYVNVTNSELWVAYNFIQPSAPLQKLYKQERVNLTSPAVVGLSIISSGQSVALSPALAGTTTGWNAIYADSIIGKAHSDYLAGSGTSLPIVLRSIEWANFRWEILQWYDEESVLQKDFASLSVTPKSGPLSCLLRMRIAIRTKPLTSSKREEELAKVAAGMLQQAYPGKAEQALAEARKLIKKQSPKQRFPRGEQLFEFDTQPDLFGGKLNLPPKNAEEELEAVVLVLRAAGRSSGYIKSFLKRAEQRVSDAEGWKSTTWPPDSLSRLCAEYPPLAAMDRMARLVAILNWYTRTTGSKMPELPKWVSPVWKPTPNTLSAIHDPYWASMIR